MLDAFRERRMRTGDEDGEGNPRRLPNSIRP